MITWISRSLTLAIVVMSLVCNLHSQNTVGVLQHYEDRNEGYTFFSPFTGTKAYLIDECGRLINSWDRGTQPGLSAYFLENGLMLRTYKISPNGPFTSASNAGGLELVDWDNNTVWQYEINSEEQLSHHDAVYMPNGNILVLTWELTYREELISLGRDPAQIASQGYMWSEKILELKPIGMDSAEIVWQWHINDHYIQDFDPSMTGFGNVADHPELFDINLPDLNSNNSNATRDWNHFNAIDYNPELDQILISVRNSDEIWILDHSTRTEEAASHSGGRYGKGGDILYRWGNASAYKAAPEDEQMLWGQHGAHWVSTESEYEGMIMVFNNGNGKPGDDYSQVQIIDPPQDSSGFYTTNNGKFGPAVAITLYGNLPGERFYSAFLSNAHMLEGDHVLVNSGSPGRIFEIDSERSIVWAYEIPLFGDFPASQGQAVNNNSNFRAYKYPPQYAGFTGKDLTPGLPIETNPSECTTLTSSNHIQSSDLKCFYDYNLQQITILSLEHPVDKYKILHMDGSLMQSGYCTHTHIKLSQKMAMGLYVVQLQLTDGSSIVNKMMLY